MKLNYDELLAKANGFYVAQKVKRHGIDLRYTAPEAMPCIASDQVKAILRVLVDAINEEDTP